MRNKKFKSERLNALSDGVIAIALTLLVLGIDIPTDHNFTEDGLVSFLIKLEPGLVAYLTSFIIVAIYWLIHHRMFNVLKYTDRILVILNIVFLFSISLVPFIAKLKTLYRYDALVVLIYGAVHIFTGLILFVLWKYIVSQKDLLEYDVGKNEFRYVSAQILVMPIISVVAIVLAFINVHWGTYFFALIPIIYVFMMSRNGTLKQSA
jgi:uncharacterized membrane protein